MKDGGGYRTFWLALGLLSLALGAIGAVLPLLPTTPFILLAAYAFARSSARLHDWLHAHAYFGPLIRNWQEHGAISRRGKIAAVIVMAATPVVSAFLGAPNWAIAGQIVVLLAVGAFVLSRPEV